MLPKYEDILALADRADVKPFWWSEYGVPRFAPFHPSLHKATPPANQE